MKKVCVLDVDGTITYHIKFFAKLTCMLGRNEWKIVILTSRGSQWKSYIKKDLNYWEVFYDKLICYPQEQIPYGKAYLPKVAEWKLKEIEKIKKDADQLLWFDDDPNLSHECLIKP